MPHVEGQPLLIQRIIRPFKRRAEHGKRREPLLTPQQKESSRVFQDNFERSMREHLAWLDSQPKANLSYQEWIDVRAGREREKQEKIARGEFPDINRPAPLVPEKLVFNETIPLTSEQREERNNLIVRELKKQVIAEVKRSTLPLIAEDIKKTLWGNNGAIIFNPCRGK